MPFLINFIQHFTAGPRQCNKTRKIKAKCIRKEEVEPPFLADDIIMYVENCKECNKVLPVCINKFIEVTGYSQHIKINCVSICLQKSILK